METMIEQYLGILQYEAQTDRIACCIVVGACALLIAALLFAVAIYAIKHRR